MKRCVSDRSATRSESQEIVSGHLFALGPLTDLHHQLDQYLASAGRPPAHPSQEGGLLFVTGQGVPVAAFALADAGIALVACPGHVPAGPLQRLREDDVGRASESRAPWSPLEPLDRDVVVRWRDAGMRWSLSVERTAGVASLYLLMPGLPETASCWDGHLQAFDKAFAHWAGRLQAEPAMRCVDRNWSAAMGGHARWVRA